MRAQMWSKPRMARRFGLMLVIATVGLLPRLVSAQEAPNPTCDDPTPVTVPGVLDCATTTTTTPPTATPTTPTTTTFTTEPTSPPDTMPQTVLPPLGGPVPGFGDLPSAEPTAPEVVGDVPEDQTAPLTRTPVPAASVGNPGFAYPIVFVLPLLLVSLVLILGRVLTAPVGSARRRSNRVGRPGAPQV